MADSDDRCNILKIPDLFLFRNNFPNSDPMPSFNRQKPLAGSFSYELYTGNGGYITMFLHQFLLLCQWVKFFLSLFFIKHVPKQIYGSSQNQSMIQQDPSVVLRKHRQNLILSFLFSSCPPLFKKCIWVEIELKDSYHW